MSLYTPPNLTSGMDDAISQTVRAVPSFGIMLMVFTYLLVLIGGSSNQKKRLGTADYPMWSVLAGLTITFEALLMTIGTGILDITTLGIVIGVTILSAIWFFLSKQRGEQ